MRLHKKPGIAVISFQENGGSKIYRNQIKKDCDSCGIYYEEHIFLEDLTQEEIDNCILFLNGDSKIDGIMVQTPIPANINKNQAFKLINPLKDIDCCCTANQGKLLIGTTPFVPCTPLGIMMMLDYYHIQPEKKKCAILGRSNTVGKPLFILLAKRDASVTMCHSKTSGLNEICKYADILISAVGKPNTITKDMVKQGATVIDVGINIDHDGKICGDVAPDVVDVATALTPVPGGVGKTTRIALLKNLLIAAKLNQNI